MKTLQHKFTLLILFILPLVMMANTDPEPDKFKGKYTKEKTLKKEFNVNPDALFKVKNSYGNLNLTSWNENRIVIEVHIKTNGNNEERVQKRLDEIRVDFDHSDALVSAITRFGERSTKWGWNWGNRNNVNIQVNYTVKIPVKNSVQLNNNYGNIYLDRIDGHAKINCDYGKMDIGELRGRNNELRFDYTSKSSFEYINSAEIVADYSGFTIEKAGNLKIKADYTNAVIHQIGNLDYSSDYGSIEVKELENINGNGDYIGVKLGIVHGNVDISSDYGSLKIQEMAKDAGNINIKSDYTGIKIGYAPDYHFDFEVSTDYAGVCGKEPFEIRVREERTTGKYYSGHYGKQNSGNRVQISSDYGSIAFHQQ